MLAHAATRGQGNEITSCDGGRVRDACTIRNAGGRKRDGELSVRFVESVLVLCL